MRRLTLPLTLWAALGSALPGCLAASADRASMEDGECDSRAEATASQDPLSRQSGAPPCNPLVLHAEWDARADCLRSPNGSCLPNPDGCQRLDIQVLGARVTQRCVVAGGTVLTRQGTQTRATCSDQATAQGQPCVACALPGGDIIADGCHLPASTPSPRCEPLDTATGASCQVCTPPGGGVVLSRRCDPPSSARCTMETDPALGLCRACVAADGTPTGRTCEPPALAPETTRCRVVILPADLRQPATRCHLCQDATQAITQWNCFSDGAAIPPVCSSFLTDDGASCTTCQDPRTGVEVSRRCDPSPPRPVVCSTLADFSGGPRCEVCEDSLGHLVSRRCAVGGCVPGSMAEACQEAPPACTLREDENLGACHTCTDVDGNGVVGPEDELCARIPAPGPALSCFTALDLRRPGSRATCRVCLQGGVEVSRACQEEGALPAATCGPMSLPGGVTCTTCSDASGRTVFNGCGDALACGSWNMTREDGTRATCDRCVEAITTCVTDQDCGAGEVCGLNGCFFPTELLNRDHVRQKTCVDQGAAACSLGPDGSAACPEDSSLWMVTLPGVCSNPWELWFRDQGGPLPVDADGQGEVVRAWLAATAGVTVAGHRLLMGVAPVAPSACSGCACPRGEAISVLARPRDVSVLRALGFVLAP